MLSNILLIIYIAFILVFLIVTPLSFRARKKTLRGISDIRFAFNKDLDKLVQRIESNKSLELQYNLQQGSTVSLKDIRRLDECIKLISNSRIKFDEQSENNFQQISERESKGVLIRDDLPKAIIESWFRYGKTTDIAYNLKHQKEGKISKFCSTSPFSAWIDEADLEDLELQTAK